MSNRCIVLNCTNRRHQGTFVGDLCYPCWAFVCEGRGVHSQAFRNAIEGVATAAKSHVSDDRIPLVRREP